MTGIEQKPVHHGRDHEHGSPDVTRIHYEDTGTGGGATGGGVLVQPGHRLGTTEDRWYVPGPISSGTLGTNNTTANRLEAYPFVTTRDMTLDQVIVQVTSAISSSQARVGMYTDDGNLYPDALLFDTGAFSTATSGVKQTAISQGITAGTLYWAAIATSHSTVQHRSVQAADMMVILGWPAPSGTTSPQHGFGWFVAHTFAALPDPFTAGASAMTAADGVPTAIFLRGT